MAQEIPSQFGQPYAYFEISNRDDYIWNNVKEDDVVVHASCNYQSIHFGAHSNCTSRLSLTPTHVEFYNDFIIQRQMILRGIELQEAPVGDNTPYQVTQQVSDMKGYDPWGDYIKITFSNTQVGFQVLDANKVPVMTLSTTTGRIHTNRNDSAGDPSYSWCNNSDLGLYHYGTDIIGFASRGLESARLESYGRLVLSNQSVLEPGANYLRLIPTGAQCNVEMRFHATSNLTRPEISLYDSTRKTLQVGKSLSNAYVYTQDGQPLVFQNGGTGEFRFQATSNLTRPELTLYDNARQTVAIGKSLSNAYLYTQDGQPLVFQNGGTGEFRFQATSNLTRPELTLFDSARQTVAIGKSLSNAYVYTQDGQPLIFQNGGPGEFRFQATSNLTRPELTLYDSSRQTVAIGKSLSNAYVYTQDGQPLVFQNGGRGEFRFQATSNLTRPELTLYDSARQTVAIGKSLSNAYVYTQDGQPLVFQNGGPAELRFQSVSNLTRPELTFFDSQRERLVIGKSLSNAYIHVSAQQPLVLHNSFDGTPAAPVAPMTRSNLRVQQLIDVSRNATFNAVKENNNYFGWGYEQGEPTVRVQSTDNLTYTFNDVRRVSIMNNGNTGIGTDALPGKLPTKRVHVLGSSTTPPTMNLTSTDTTAATYELLVNAPTGTGNAAHLKLTTTELELRDTNTTRHMRFLTSDTERVRMLNTGQVIMGDVSINATRATHALAVQNAGGTKALIYNNDTNNAQIDLQNTKGMFTIASGATTATLTENDSRDIHIRHGTNERIFIRGSDGHVGIGTTSPSTTYKLHVEGSIFATGDVMSQSDARLKSELQPIDSALAKVLALTGYTYVMTDKGKETTKRQVGLLAQDVDKVLPEAVISDPTSGYMSLAYGNIAALLIEAIKELHHLLPRS